MDKRCYQESTAAFTFPRTHIQLASHTSFLQSTCAELLVSSLQNSGVQIDHHALPSVISHAGRP